MTSHVLGKGQGYPVGSKMPGAFDTVEALLCAFVRDYKPCSSKPEPGKVAEPELMLLVFTYEELKRMKDETGAKFYALAIQRTSKRLNIKMGFEKGFRAVAYYTNLCPVIKTVGLIFCPDQSEWPTTENHEQVMKTGPSTDENLNSVEYFISPFTP